MQDTKCCIPIYGTVSHPCDKDAKRSKKYQVRRGGKASIRKANENSMKYGQTSRCVKIPTSLIPLDKETPK